MVNYDFYKFCELSRYHLSYWELITYHTTFLVPFFLNFANATECITLNGRCEVKFS